MRNGLLTSFRLSALAAVAAAGITPSPLLAQPAPCSSPTVTVTTSPEPVAEPEVGGGTTTVEFEIAVDVGGDEYCFWEVTYQTGEGDAAPGEDYQPVDPTAECKSGNDTIAGRVRILGDTVSEPDETFEIQVPTISVGGCADGNSFDVDESATVTITNYQAPSVSIDDVQVKEGDAGVTDAVFTVRVEPPAAEPVAVGFQTEHDTATVSDGDYKAQFGSVTIAPAEPHEATITVPVVGDTRVEEDETFIVLLTSADGVEIADGEGVGTILNDDQADTVPDEQEQEGEE